MLHINLAYVHVSRVVTVIFINTIKHVVGEHMDVVLVIRTRCLEAFTRIFLSYEV